MRSLIIDTDPGIDDAVALLLALRSPEVSIAAITTVFGNHDITTTTENTLALLALAGRPDIPVAVGAAQPLMRPFLGGAEVVHGPRALGGAPMPAPQSQAVSTPAHELIIELARQSPGAITLVAIAPLTNLALALRAEPRVADWIADVIVMGGAFTSPGNITPYAEANIYHDPEAAHLVFSASWRLHVLGLDVTHQAILDETDVARFGTLGTPIADFVACCMPTYQQFYRQAKGQSAIPMHDPAAIAYAVAPDLFETVPARVMVDLSDGPTRGQTVTDLDPMAVASLIQLVTRVDLTRFKTLLEDRVI